MKLVDIISSLESAFPLKDATNWDFVGWQVRSKSKIIDIVSILIALDITESVIDEAIKNNIKLIIVHHPFIFANNISDLPNNKWKKELYQKLITYNINVYVLHTNFDKNINGMSFLIAKQLLLDQVKYFDEEKFSVLGTYDDFSLKKVIKIVKKYFAYDSIKVISNDLSTKINKVLVAPGAAGNIIESLSKSNCTKNDISLIITGEMKWHQELEARDKKISVLILGHNMEEKFVDFIADFLIDKVINSNVEIKKYFFDQPILI